jgi:hypothetical protein
MLSQLPNNNTKTGGSQIAFVFGGLLAFGLCVFALLVSRDGYFNDFSINSMGFVIAICVAIFVVAMVWGKSVDSKLGKTGGMPLSARMILVALYVPFIFYAILSLGIRLTSNEQVALTTQIYASGKGRGCAMYFYFYNPPIGRTSSICHDRLFWRTQSGDFVTVSEGIGPLGARLQSITYAKP